MLRSYGRLLSWLRRDEGQSLVEYSMLIGFIALAVFALLAALGQQVGATFSKLTQEIITLTGPG